MSKKRGILVQLDRRRCLRLDLATVCRFELTVGKLFFSMATWENLSTRDAIVLLWSCLAWEDPGLTPADVLRMFELEEVNETAVISEMRTAFERLMNDLAGGN